MQTPSTKRIASEHDSQSAITNGFATKWTGHENRRSRRNKGNNKKKDSEPLYFEEKEHKSSNK